MEINNINMKVNDAAFMGSNTEEAIEFCPFCGVKKNYLVHELNQENLNEKNKLDDYTLRILDHAVKLELFNADFYKKAALLAKDSRIKKMFMDLSRIEHIHAKIHLRLGGFSEVPKLKDMSYDRYSEDLLLIEQAKLREKHAVEYYSKYMNDVFSDSIKEILKVLQEVESDHITLLCN
jgi:rubrerythrin